MTEKTADNREPADEGRLDAFESPGTQPPEKTERDGRLEDISVSLSPDDPLPDASLPDEPSLTEQKWQRVYRYGFSVAGVQLLAPENNYCELLTNFRLSRIPNSPEHFLGITNVRGNLIPVYQLETLCGLASPKPTYALIIGELHQGAALVIADKPQAVDRDSLETGQPEQTIPPVLSETVTHAGYDGKTEWYTLKPAKLFHDLANWVT